MPTNIRGGQHSTKRNYRPGQASPFDTLQHLVMSIVLVLNLSLISLPLCSQPQAAYAGPVLPEMVELSQPDSFTFPAVPYGDEWQNGYETVDGLTILQDEQTGYWHYALADAEGKVVPQGPRVGAEPVAGIQQHLRPATPAAGPLSPGAGPMIQGEIGAMANTGTQKVLVILVSFSNRAPVGSTANDWSNLFFTTTNSLKDYYNEVSYGNLNFDPATESHGTANDGIVGWLNLGYNHPNTRDLTGDANRQLAKNAILAADPYVDFAAFDTNGDGYISAGELHIVTVAAGYETSYGGTYYAFTPNVWAHNWSFYGTVPAPTVDGKIIGQVGYGGYSQLGEWHAHTSDNPGHMATMGPFVHEMGHDLNWPDLYDVDNSSEGVGEWSIMGSGSWLYTTGDYGSKPGHPDAFSKIYQGWLVPTQLTGSNNSYVVGQVETNPLAIQLLDNPSGIDWLFNSHSGTGEYFLVENRQLIGYDAGLPGAGLLVWHVDETRTYSNYANATDSRRLVDLEEADGLGHLDSAANRGDGGDVYPGTSNNYTFNNSSAPNSRLYSTLASGVSVTNISASAVTMTVDFGVPSPEATSTATASSTTTSTSTSTSTVTSTPTQTATSTPTETVLAAATTTIPAISTPTQTATVGPADNATPEARSAFLPVILKDYHGGW